MMDLDLYVQLKHLNLVASYTEYKALDPDEAQGILESHQALVAKLEEEREKIRKVEAEKAKKQAEFERRKAELEEMASRYTRGR